jgi:hypothetical protein
MRPVSVFLLFIISFSGFGQSKGGPEWVYRVPREPGFYFGVGISSLSDRDYRLESRKKALREIAESIVVEVNSSSKLAYAYEDEETSYQLDEQIELKSDLILEDCEKIDEWVDKKKDNYYVLLRLDREAFSRKRSERFARNEQSIEEYLDLSAKWFLSEDYKKGFIFLNDALGLIKKESEYFFEPNYLHLLQTKKREVKNLFKDRLLRLSIDLDDYEYGLDPVKNDLRIPFEFKDRLSEEHVPDFDFSLASLKGDVFSFHVFHTDTTYELTLEGLLPEKEELVFFIIPVFEESVAYFEDWLSLEKEIVSKPIVLKVRDIPVRFSGSEKIYGKETEEGRFTQFFRQFLDLCAFDRTPEQGEQPFYLVESNTVTSKKGHSKTSYIAEIKGEIRVTMGDDQDQFIVYQLPGTRGYGNSWQLAADNAAKGLINRINGLLEEMITEIRTIPTSE